MPQRGRVSSPRWRVLVLLCGVSPLFVGAAKPLDRMDAPGVPTVQANEEYPDWFIRTPSGAASTAVGFAPMYLDTATSVAEAIEHGKAALRLSARVRVRAEYLQETLVDGKVDFRGEQYVEDTLSAPIDSVVTLDTAYQRRMVLVLVSAADAPLARGRRARFPSDPPAWVTETPRPADGFAAVGTASAHFDEIRAWGEAERQARRSLAFATVTRMRSALEARAGGTSNGALIAATATEIRDVRVVERWRDDRRLYVLIHARHAGPLP